MDNVGNFFNRLGRELSNSLSGTFGLFSGSQESFASSLAGVLEKVIVSILLVLIFVLAYLVLRWLLNQGLKHFRLSQEITKPLVLALKYTVTVLAALAVMAQFGVSAIILGAAAKAAVVAFLYYLVWVIAVKLLSSTLRHYALDHTLEQLLRNVLLVLILSFGFVTVMSQFGVDVLSVIAALGVVGIAVGFAAQDTLSNFISGVTLLIERPFRINDWVEINGQIGKVEAISLRTTRLITRDNVLSAIPNASVASAEIINFSAGGPLRVRIGVGIAYKESAQAARKIILPILQAHDLVMKNRQPSVHLAELADSSVNLNLYYWIEPDHIDIQPKISAEILERCKEALDAAGIEIPFPHLQLFVDGAKGLSPVLEPFYAQRS